MAPLITATLQHSLTIYIACTAAKLNSLYSSPLFKLEHLQTTLIVSVHKLN